MQDPLGSLALHDASKRAVFPEPWSLVAVPEGTGQPLRELARDNPEEVVKQCAPAASDREMDVIPLHRMAFDTDEEPSCVLFYDLMSYLEILWVPKPLRQRLDVRFKYQVKRVILAEWSGAAPTARPPKFTAIA